MQATFTAREYSRVAVELLSVVKFLHLQGVVHHDLTPQNVRLSTGNKTVKLTDFGISNIDRATTTRGLGTVAFQAPECLVEDDFRREFDTIDLFALGMLLWQGWFQTPPFDQVPVPLVIAGLRTGRRPLFEVDAELEKDDADEAGALKRTRRALTQRPKIPVVLRSLIEQLWQQQPEDRPPASDALAKFMADCAPAIETLVLRHTKAQQTLEVRQAASMRLIPFKKLDAQNVPESTELQGTWSGVRVLLQPMKQREEVREVARALCASGA
jgi:serine/threonine protein kinase